MRSSHPLLPNLDEKIVSEMLGELAADSVEELFSDVPEELRLKRPLRIPEGQSEMAVRRNLVSLLSKNQTPPEALCFLGGGVWPHYIPAVVDSITSRQEFYTSYTPYQAEASQGMLQALFEYQSLMCDLLGMEACNSSMYDWASAAAEAVRMALHVTGRTKILISGNVGPERLEVIRTYLQPLDVTIDVVDFNLDSGETNSDAIHRQISDEHAGIYFENPNYFGVVEEKAAELAEIVHKAGGLALVGVDPISLSAIKEPGAYGADIVVGEGQPLGIPMNYGGPHLGIFAVRDMKLARNMPGRLIGITTTKGSNQKAFCMVLQTREQHIRRELATSNICTNQSLMAVAAGCYLSLLGKNGFKSLGEAVMTHSHYAASRLARIRNVSSPLFNGPFFKEFVVGYNGKGVKASQVFEKLANNGIFGGYPVTSRFPRVGEAGLFCVTEVHSKTDIDKLADALEGALV
jgi:glycine dehydrogenase subunit 1